MKGTDPRQKRGYDFLGYFDNNQGTINSATTAVALYEGVWHRLGHSNRRNTPTLGPALLKVHQYDVPEDPLETLKEPTPEPPPIYTPLAPGMIPMIKEE